MSSVDGTYVSHKTHYARLGHAAQHLLPSFLQEVLLQFENPNQIYINCSRNKSLSRRLNPGEWARLSNAVQHGYFEFDIPLIYSILRNLHEPAARPTRGWEHPIGPLVNEIEIGDDIERCRRLRNEIIHRGNTRVTDLELTQYFYVFKTIADRFEKVCGKHNNEFVFEVEHLKTCCMDEATELQYLDQLKDFQQKDMEYEAKISDLEYKLKDGTYLSHKTHYARLGHAAQHLLPSFLQEVLLRFENPNQIYINCSRNKFLSRRLKPGEWARLSSAVQHGYFEFDIPLIYSILRNLHDPAVRPTRGWDHPIGPLVNEIEIGDDIERCRRLQNEIIHRGNTRVTDLELTQYFYVFKTIAVRFEKVCGKHNNEFVFEVEHLKTCCMDEATELQYLDHLTDFQQKDMENEAKISDLEYKLKGKDIQLPWLVNAGEFQRMLSNGEYLSYENRLSLGGPCKAGKSTLASLLIGNEIPLNWNSTDGVVIYFGREWY
ncbi:unnamed protein product [Mytilus coruscus]|uniref:DZIP3-like HEPN domain-containing protein n=1 Tax=Mytilus coruscus TaxID=42192 RepID=A0A6J8CLA3_MYTCO|nr:unnamed protein product [Mytilus coruscus]